LPSHSCSAQLSGGRPLYCCLLAHKQSVKHHNSAPTYFEKAHQQKPILPTSTIKMKGSGDVLQGRHIKGRLISCDAFIILHIQQRNWYLYHNITTELLWKNHNISTKMIPFGACQPFLVDHHNILIGKGGRLGILC
jgi:hypothetical protein